MATKHVHFTNGRRQIRVKTVQDMIQELNRLPGDTPVVLQGFEALVLNYNPHIVKHVIITPSNSLRIDLPDEEATDV